MYSNLGFMEEDTVFNCFFFVFFGPDVGYWLGQPKNKKSDETKRY